MDCFDTSFFRNPTESSVSRYRIRVEHRDFYLFLSLFQRYSEGTNFGELPKTMRNLVQTLEVKRRFPGVVDHGRARRSDQWETKGGCCGLFRVKKIERHQDRWCPGNVDGKGDGKRTGLERLRVSCRNDSEVTLRGKGV